MNYLEFLKYYEPNKPYHFQGLDELEIYLNPFKKTYIEFQTWEYKLVKNSTNLRDKLCRISDHFQNTEINENLNTSNKPDTNIILSDINFQVLPCKIKNYSSGFQFNTTINQVTWCLFSIHFGRQQWNTRTKNKLVFHWKFFASFTPDFQKYFIQTNFNTDLFEEYSKSFDICLDIPKLKKEILNPLEIEKINQPFWNMPFYHYSENEYLDNKENILKDCVLSEDSVLTYKNKSWLFYMVPYDHHETLYFRKYQDPNFRIRLYDKIAEARNDGKISLYDWIWNYKNMNRLEVQFETNIANNYKRQDLLDNKNNILENLFYEKTSIYFSYVRNHITLDWLDKSFKSMTINRIKRNTWITYLEYWNLPKKYTQVIWWWIKNLYSDIWPRGLAYVIMDNKSQKEKETLLMELINYTFLDDEKINEKLEDYKKTLRLINRSKENEKYRLQPWSFDSDFIQKDEIIKALERYNKSDNKQIQTAVKTILNKTVKLLDVKLWMFDKHYFPQTSPN